MGSQKGFVFSLDAFVAFTLALVAIYSLIFFSSVPSGYYATLTQAHLLTKDTLYALGHSKCTFAQCSDAEASALQNLVFRTRSGDLQGAIQGFIGARIPNQFGYKFEVFNEGALEPTYTYDTSDPANRVSDPHKDKRDKLSVSTSAVVYEYTRKPPKIESPFAYRTCKGTAGADICHVPDAEDDYIRDYAIKVVKLTVFI